MAPGKNFYGIWSPYKVVHPGFPSAPSGFLVTCQTPHSGYRTSDHVVMFHLWRHVLQKPGLSFLSWRLVKIFTECGHYTRHRGPHTNITPGISIRPIRILVTCHTSHLGHRTSDHVVIFNQRPHVLQKPGFSFFVMAPGKNFYGMWSLYPT
jgi:hypothetical protein